MTPQGIATLVAAGGFTIAFVFGFVGAKANFCTMGALSDVVNMGHWGRVRMWLLAVAVVDRLENGLSAIYTYYEPAEEKRSLGSYVILWQIGRARELGLPAVYLGYWIRNCRKMNYKTRFRPVELLANGHWVRVD